MIKLAGRFMLTPMKAISRMYSDKGVGKAYRA